MKVYTPSFFHQHVNLQYIKFLKLIVVLLGLNLISINVYALGAEPVSPEAAVAHSGITEYTGPETCVACHEAEAKTMHLSVHYQQTGDTPNVPNIFGTAGKSEGAFNTYCGSIRTSPNFTCAGCHVSNGLPTSPVATTEQLNNIDCLMCHQDDYARTSAPPYQDFEVTGADGNPTTISIPFEETFRFMPDESKMGISILQAARTVHPTTRKTCLRCHAGASGSDGGKRGDISSVTVNPPISSDYHMSPAGENIVCANCHDAGNHRVMGRGLDLRPNDVAEALNCTKCHDEAPHSGTKLDNHTARVACQACHIPTYAKDISTEMERDWTVTHFSTSACSGRGGWVPEEIRQSNVIPSYQWFDGTSQVYVLDQIPTINADGEKEFGVPNGDVTSEAAKIYPMKEHRSVAAQHDATGLMVPHSTFTFFTTGSFDQAVREGMDREGMFGSYSLVNVHTYQTINHGVEAAGKALDCSECHAAFNNNTTPTRIDLQADLGYELKASLGQLCSECHDREESLGFVDVHNKHVKDERVDCSGCHNFTRPERLSPRFSGFWPATGSTGTIVFAFGENFIENETQISVGGTPAPFLQIQDFSLSLFLVPPGNPTGPITVTTPYGTADSVTDFNVPLVGLNITGVWPSEVRVGSLVFVFGSGYAVGPGQTKLAVNGVNAPFIQVQDEDLLIFLVPSGVTSGSLTVTTTSPVASASSSIPLIVLP